MLLRYSSKTPEASLFLEPLYNELKILEKGIELHIYTDSGFINRICGCILHPGSSDLPAWYKSTLRMREKSQTWVEHSPVPSLISWN